MKQTSMLSNFAIALLCTLPLYSQAAHVYLGQSAAGAEDGSSCANARAYTYFNTVGNWGTGGTQIGPGTTVHICGVWTGSAGQAWLNAQSDGTEANPITILWENNAVLSAPYHTAAGGNAGVRVSDRSHFILDGGTNGVIENTDNGSALTYKELSVAIQALNVTNVTVRNLTIRGLFVHVQCLGEGCPADVQVASVNAIQFGGNDISIHDNTITDVGWALSQNATASDDNIRIYRNSISRMDHGIACGAGANETLYNIYIYNNHFGEMYNWDTGTNNHYHHDAIHCFSSSTNGTVKNLYIYNNLFDGKQGDCCVTASVFLQGGVTRWADATGKLYLFNNVFSGTLALGNGQIGIGSGGEHLIANNTIIGGGEGAGTNAVCVNIWGGEYSQAVTVKNNIMSGCRQYYRMDAAVDTLTANRNLFALLTTGGNPIWQWEEGSASASVFATWQSNSSQDANSTHSAAGQPGLASNWVPLVDSVAVGGGENLTALCTGELTALCADKAGVARPAEGAWDIGAYQYQAPATPRRPLQGNARVSGSARVQ